ncbi:MAG: type II secretion system protein GspG [Nitrospirota bacterium]
MQVRKQSGFTLVEVIVVAGIIAILAGILVPLILKEIDEARISRAAADVRSISNALIILKKDTGQWPITATCGTANTLLQGQGALPTIVGTGWTTTTPDQYDNYLMVDDNGCWPVKWKGPYLAGVNADPWGNAYITNADNFLAASGAVWIISAGPDGVIDTSVTNSTIVGDDVGARIR